MPSGHLGHLNTRKDDTTNRNGSTTEKKVVKRIAAKKPPARVCIGRRSQLYTLAHTNLAKAEPYNEQKHFYAFPYLGR